ncbi:elongation factor P maturation arginine rhamnosyltransferase EarP [Verticiella sediminum]|uniref:Protein-arginine rhamnosyltransferase n=1 Tax=Verticiella sediminum TaxID=1247510 RepID=A0A556AZM6_9BURK|nr:elongation factor P maturation arginine rhamnosyltransferase EarP [Verticiella sediminum]TSH98390.1 elongation factor P maturation arginine rhamnosyltransferase EarP [Verticiella sediminum]
MPQPRCDIFCRVIDNYGDVGVCWRLARRLADGHGWSVRLWVDAPEKLARIACGAAADGVQIVAWSATPPDLAPGDIVIEAFACDPPPAFVARIRPEGVWLNLEYLSAEPWVESHHGLPSPQLGGRTKYFFFPGFTARTGGLLREPGLLARRDAFQADPQAIARYLQEQAGLPAALAGEIGHGARALATLFCYPDAPARALLASLRGTGQPWALAVTGDAMPGLAGQAHGLPIVRVPFLPQADYDPLLWAARLNAVRGEDSFVRAQWAGRPLLWHIYRQDDDVHLDKLAAWLDAANASPAARAAQFAWNRGGPGAAADLAAWLAPAAQAQSQRDARAWADTLAAGPELADALAKFCGDRLKS